MLKLDDHTKVCSARQACFPLWGFAAFMAAWAVGELLYLEWFHG